MSAIVIQNNLVHYEAIGRGRESLVFLHGWLGSWRYWVPAMEELSATRRTYALDLWGFGDTDKVSVRYDIGAYVKLLSNFLNELGAQKISLVGHALGGVVALVYAAIFPDQVDKVMGVSVPLSSSSIGRPLSSFSGNGNALERLVSRQANFPEVLREVRKTDAEAVLYSMHSTMENDLRELLFGITPPVLLVYGEEDVFISPPKPEWTRDFAASVRSISLQGARHFPMLEEKNKFNRLLMEFLDVGGDLDSLRLKEEWRRRTH